MDGRTTIVLSGASFKGLDTNSPQIKNSAIDNWLCHARNLCPSKRGQPMSFRKRATNVRRKEGNQCPSKRGQPMSFQKRAANVLPKEGNQCPSKRGQPMSFQKRATNVLPKEGNQCPSKRGQPMSFQKRATNVLPKEGNQCPSKRGQPMSFRKRATNVRRKEGNLPMVDLFGRLLYCRYDLATCYHQVETFGTKKCCQPPAPEGRPDFSQCVSWHRQIINNSRGMQAIDCIMVSRCTCRRCISGPLSLAALLGQMYFQQDPVKEQIN